MPRARATTRRRARGARANNQPERAVVPTLQVVEGTAPPIATKRNAVEMVKGEVFRCSALSYALANTVEDDDLIANTGGVYLVVRDNEDNGHDGVYLLRILPSYNLEEYFTGCAVGHVPIQATLTLND